MGTATTIFLIAIGGFGVIRTVFAVSVLPGLAAVVGRLLLVRDRSRREAAAPTAPLQSRAEPFPPWFRLFLLAEIVFGLG